MMEININLKWWFDDSDTVPEEHKYELIEVGLCRVKELHIQGYISGELSTMIDENHYNGHWEIKEI